MLVLAENNQLKPATHQPHFAWLDDRALDRKARQRASPERTVYAMQSSSAGIGPAKAVVANRPPLRGRVANDSDDWEANVLHAPLTLSALRLMIAPGCSY